MRGGGGWWGAATPHILQKCTITCFPHTTGAPSPQLAKIVEEHGGKFQAVPNTATTMVIMGDVARDKDWETSVKKTK